jgi:hypothetical protein
MHVGKQIVFSTINAVQYYLVGGPLTTARKRWLYVLPSMTPGTVGALWADRQILSTVVERWPDDERENMYRYDNPDHAGHFAIERLRLVPGPDIGLSDEMYYVQTLTFWDGSTKIAENDSPTEWRFVLGNWSIWAQPQGPTWDYRISIPQWNTMSTRSKAAIWADQPEYEPYNTRP